MLRKARQLKLKVPRRGLHALRQSSLNLNSCELANKVNTYLAFPCISSEAREVMIEKSCAPMQLQWSAQKNKVPSKRTTCKTSG